MTKVSVAKARRRATKASTVSICLLRGINVSGQKIIKMVDLRASFEALGFTHVTTYVQSGNVIFSASKASGTKLAQAIQKKIKNDFGFDVDLVVLDSDELERISLGNPFLRKKGTDASALYCTILAEPTDRTRVRHLERFATNGESIAAGLREIYLSVPKGYGKSKLNNNVIEKTLSVMATTRNWNSIVNLTEMALDIEKKGR